MRYGVSACLMLVLASGAVRASGLLIPEDKTLPPLAMVHHKVTIAIDDQVAVTTVEQSFRNHTDRQLEATYLFPVPKGASVNRFTMIVDGKEVAGEMVEAGKARQIYTDIVRRTQDPGLLEYMGNNLMRIRVFPILPKKDQKITLRYTSIAPQESGVIEYVYPLKTDGKATATLEEFSIKATIKSQHPIQTVYSPTHAVALKREGSREVGVTFEKSQALLDKDFQLFYTVGNQEVGLTALQFRPVSTEDGHFLLLISPNVEVSPKNLVPRDMVFVLDTSGSMAGPKMEQAKKALKYCLERLNSTDRFAVMNFSTLVNRYRDKLCDPTKEQVADACRWVDNLKPTGGTAILDALNSALELRPGDEGRTFTVVFFTDGQPTVGETNPDRILKAVAGKNTTNTRIFTFGVGDDVNANLLDQLADGSRAVSTYVRPAEDIEAKTSSLYSKITYPVLANLKLTCGENVRISEVYPPQLPDLFQGGQLVVLGRYTGTGPTAIKLAGSVGMEAKEYTYELSFAPKTEGDREFVEHLWARRKVGYLLDQIRANGEKKELVDEVMALAKKYGIATPYTSYLIVPDAPIPVAGGVPGMPGTPAARMAPLGGPGGPGMGAPGIGGSGGRVMGGAGIGGFGGGFGGMGGFGGGFGGMPGGDGRGLFGADGNKRDVLGYARANQSKPGDLGAARGGRAEKELAEAESALKGLQRQQGGQPGAPAGAAPSAQPQQQLAMDLAQLREQKQALDKAKDAFAQRRLTEAQTGNTGVNLAIAANGLKNQERLTQTAQRRAGNRNVMELGGVWIDEGFDPKMQAVVIKAQSDAYFRILERQPQVRDVYRLGNHIVWVTPSNTALVIDTDNGKDKLSDEEIDKLFAAATPQK